MTPPSDTQQPETAPIARPKWLPEETYPFEIRALGAGHERIAYTDVGQGPTMLFVHTGMWSFVWRDLIDILRTDFRCITLDAPASGLSGGTSRRHATLREAGARLTRLVGALGLDDLTLVAHDLGGPASLLAAADWPPQTVRRLVAVNAFGWQPSGPLFRGMLGLMGSAPMREIDALTGFLPRITSGAFGVGRHLDRNARRTFRDGVDHRGRRSFHRYMRDARRRDIYRDIDAATAALTTLPLLTIFGEHNDPMHFQRRWVELFPNTTSVVVPKGNHFPMCDAPALVATAIHEFAVATPA